MNEEPTRITVEQRGHVLMIGLNRPEKRNAADMVMLTELAHVYRRLQDDADLRVGFVFAHGDHFSGGLDLGDVAPHIGAEGIDIVPAGGLHPWQVAGEQLTKPVVLAVQGTCFTLGIEFALSADITVAADSTVFGQLEVARGILPFFGATIRFPRAVGWGNAMRWILTGDRFDAAEAYRIGLVQELVPHGEQFARGLQLAERIAAQAPLAVQASLASAKLAIRDGDAAAEAALQPALVELMRSDDSRIGLEAFLTRQPAEFTGK